MRCRLMILATILVALSQLASGAATAAPVRPDRLDPENADRTLRGSPIMTKPVGIDTPPAIPRGGQRGTNQILIICIAFPDLSSTQTTASFGNMVFGPWSPASMNDYYQEVSYGNLSLSGATVGWYTAANSRSVPGRVS